MTNSTRFSHTRGFTILEMSIVLAIIGLIVGAVMAGTKMLRQTELQSITVDYAQFAGAVGQFRQQYGGWPGDLLDATTFWNSAGGTGSISSAACVSGLGSAPTTTTCNGDNNGQISTVSATNDEAFLAWQHLMLAKLVKGRFTGLPKPTVGGEVIASDTVNGNIPGSRIKRAGWMFGYKGAGATADMYSPDLVNYIAFETATSTYVDKIILTPEEAKQIDAKLDDGAPGSGRVVPLKPGTHPNCVNDLGDVDETNDVYKLTYKGVACMLYFSLTLK